MDLPLGTIVDIPAGRGTVRFNGATSFAPGKWIGIELNLAKGKNDGAIGGVAYFHCKPDHGVFVRPSQVKIVEQPKPSPPVSVPVPQTPASAVRPGIAHKRTSSIGLPRAASLLAPSSPRSGSPATPRTPATVASPLAIRAASSRNLSRAPTQELDARPPASPATRPPPLAPPIQRPPVVTSVPTNIVNTPSPLSDVPLDNMPDVTSTRPRSPPVSPTTMRGAVDDKELQELRAKVRILETKREEEARHIQQLETKIAEAERFIAMKPKLQTKLQQQQTDLIEARRELADALNLAERTETRVLDAQEQLEMAALDKEVAEERAEAAELELEELREKLATMEVEVDVARGVGGGEDDDGDPSIKTSLQYIQLEKQNERLKEALVRLREVTQETDLDQRRRLSEMEKDLTGVDDLQVQYDATLAKLMNADKQIEELKLQVDDALEAEEMVVQLTERNLALGEKIEEQRIAIEDLEALRELNDELEENHLETEKALHEEIDAKDLEVHKHQRMLEALEDANKDREETITQFRDLVMNLQQDLEGLRSQTQTASEESAKAASQSAAVMSLNLKLQSSASKGQARAIEFELRNIEAKEGQLLLSIIQPYLPQAYVESDSDSTSCFLFFQRLGMKADLINSVVAQAHGLPDALSGPVSDLLVGVCEMRARISSVSTLCKRFATILSHCDAETFLSIGRVYPEIAPLEKRIDMHINLLRREEFREMECVSDVAKIHSQLEHIAETYFSGAEQDLGEREQGMAWALDHDIDMFTAAIGLTKTSIQAIMKDDEVVLDNGGADFDTHLFTPIQSILQKVKSAKGQSRKLCRRLEELVAESSAIKPQFVARLNSISDLVPELTNFAISLAQGIMPHLKEARASKSSFQLRKVLSLAQQTASASVGKGRTDGGSPWQAVEDYVEQVLKELSSIMPSVMEAENVVKITGTAPWVTRVNHIKAATAVNHEAEHKLTRVNEEMQSLARSLRVKDQSIQETGVKIELMERRLEASRKQADMISELEGEIAKARKQESAYEEAMEQLQSDLDTLEKDNAKLKASVAANPERQETQRPEVEAIAIEGSLETSYLVEQLEALRGTVRFLRTENSYLKSQDLLRDLEALPPLPSPIERPATPPLQPSSFDTDNSDTDEGPSTPPTLRALATETKLLYRDVIRFSASPRVVDLSAVNAKRTEAMAGNASGDGGRTSTWISRKQTPAHQMMERKKEAERLSRRVRGLVEKTTGLGSGH